MPLDDELAQTATAPATPSSRAAAPRTTFGRYRLEAVLGEGGMGVVHAAFDPELERKIALKVLRDAGSTDARARLLREARSMAKLSHPHVITVFDVGTADGHDFIAMELFEGGTLGSWLRDSAPRPRQILAAFIAAGRGLAAAHAAGIVHRDFKPGNVLRGRAGDIVVTDFGLAREAGGDVAAPPAAEASTGTTTRTQTGALLGTPAYMAPEQWTGGAVTPATDQFAFCVALWEALAGERPYRGTTVDELRTGVLGGPAQRWASMDVLLAALVRHAGRRRRWIVAGASLVAAVAIAALVIVTRQEPASDCSPPALDPGIVWSGARAAALAARDPGAAELVGNDLATWRALRPRVCTATTGERSAKLACLDAALARLDSTVTAALADRGRIDADALGVALVDPALCDRPSPPRLAQITPDLLAGFTLRQHALVGEPPPSRDELALAELATSPCARMLAIMARLEAMDERDVPANAGSVVRDMDALAELAARCEDDPIKAEVAIGRSWRWSPSNVAAAEAAIATFPQDDLRALLEGLRAGHAVTAEQWDAASASYARAIELAGHRRRTRTQIRIVRSLIHGLLARGRAEDVTRAQELYARWLPTARALGPKQTPFEEDALDLRWRLGDVAGANAELAALRARGVLYNFTPPQPVAPPIDIVGEVVDEAGAPVANAEVVAAVMLVGDAATIASSRTLLGVRVRSDRDGKFTVAGAHNYIAAQAGALRSPTVAVAPHVHLVVRPTSQLEGKVTLGATPAIGLWIVVRGEAVAPAVMVAPILADGTFRLDGVPRGKISIGVAPIGSYEAGGHPQPLVVASERVANLELAVTQTRLHVIARSTDITPPDGALIWLFRELDPGPHPTLSSLLSRAHPVKSGLFAPVADLQHPPADLTEKLHPDDMLVTVPDRPDGKLVACGLGFAKQQFAGVSLGDYGKAMSSLEVVCAHVGVDQTFVTLDVLPMRKLGK
ncbi:MAG: serine/threonine protein kinase [Deltaproteobacteria bacterium]|nr:serine/threonine protein kinase [Deltaproteobacteria bacterium]